MTEPVIIGDATRIYALCEFPSQVPRYVGKTIQPLLSRLIAHRREARRNPRLPVHRWLAKRPIGSACIKWLETVAPGGDWASREMYWIARLREDGCSLLNLTAGGEGLPGHRFTAEHRQKISDSLRTGRHFSCEQCGQRFWRKQYDIARGNAKFCSRECYQSSQRGFHKPVHPDVTRKGVAAAAAARQAQTHCKRGHSLFGENLYWTSQGSRGCRECRKLHKRNYRARR